MRRRAGVFLVVLVVGATFVVPNAGAHPDNPGTGNTHNSDGSCNVSGIRTYPCPEHPVAAFIERAYRLFVGRSPTAGDLAHWAPSVEAGSRMILTSALSTSDEWAGVEIRNLYRKALGRPADASGYSHWLGAIRQGLRVEQIAAEFYGSPEYLGRAGGTNRGFVERLYLDLLHRRPDRAGADYWVGQLNAGVTRSWVASGFYASIESRRDRVDRLYRRVLRRAPDSGGHAYWADAIHRLGDVSLAATLAASAEFFGPRGVWDGWSGGIMLGGNPVNHLARGQVALTFDDGPSRYTPQILDILAHAGVPATFFVTGGQVEAAPAIVKRMAREGHSVQNHTWSHPNLTQLGDAAIRWQFDATSNAVQAVTGSRPRCFRPPFGASNSRVRSVAHSAGLSPEVLWNVDTLDWQRPAPSTIVHRSLAHADGRGLIVLMHDGGGARANTVAALQDVIGGFKARGYDFVTLCT